MPEDSSTCSAAVVSATPSRKHPQAGRTRQGRSRRRRVQVSTIRRGPSKGRGGSGEYTHKYGRRLKKYTVQLLKTLAGGRSARQNPRGKCCATYRKPCTCALLSGVFVVRPGASCKIERAYVDRRIFSKQLVFGGGGSPFPLTELETGQALQARRCGDPSVPRRVREIRRRPRYKLPGTFIIIADTR